MAVGDEQLLVVGGAPSVACCEFFEVGLTGERRGDREVGLQAAKRKASTSQRAAEHEVARQALKRSRYFKPPPTSAPSSFANVAAWPMCTGRSQRPW